MAWLRSIASPSAFWRLTSMSTISSARRAPMSANAYVEPTKPGADDDDARLPLQLLRGTKPMPPGIGVRRPTCSPCC